MENKIKQWFPTLKHDIFTPHYKVESWIVKEVYETFRRLEKRLGLVSIDELSIETGLPTKVVISAIQELCDSPLSPVKVVITESTEFIAGSEVEEHEILKRVIEVTGSPTYEIVLNPLLYTRKLLPELLPPPQWEEYPEHDSFKNLF